MGPNKPLEMSNILIVGVARNCAGSIKNDIVRIHHAFSSAVDIKWLIVESDSDDDTPEQLHMLKSRFDLEIIVCGRLRDKYPNRTERIAICRNRYVKEIQGNKNYNSVDYIVVADLDGVNSRLRQQSVNSCWNYKLEWDACFANQAAPYYDIWALRHKFWNPNDCYEQERQLLTIGYDGYSSRNLSIYSKMLTIDKESAPIRVDSAFGGLAIYKKYLFINNYYEGLNSEGGEVCEHVSFNQRVSVSACLAILPNLINGGWNEHSKRSKSLNRLIIYLATRVFTKRDLQRLRGTFSR
jgi:hypothetical protein